MQHTILINASALDSVYPKISNDKDTQGLPYYDWINNLYSALTMSHIHQTDSKWQLSNIITSKLPHVWVRGSFDGQNRHCPKNVHINRICVGAIDCNRAIVDNFEIYILEKVQLGLAIEVKSQEFLTQF